jgi:hypothetical protein
MAEGLRDRADGYEIGPQLRLDALQVGRMVVLKANHRPTLAITAWVYDVAPETMTFLLRGNPPRRIFLVASRRGDKLFDDANHELTVFRYLGTV